MPRSKKPPIEPFTLGGVPCQPYRSKGAARDDLVRVGRGCLPESECFLVRVLVGQSQFAAVLAHPRFQRAAALVQAGSAGVDGGGGGDDGGGGGGGDGGDGGGSSGGSSGGSGGEVAGAATANTAAERLPHVHVEAVASTAVEQMEDGSGGSGCSWCGAGGNGIGSGNGSGNSSGGRGGSEVAGATAADIASPPQVVAEAADADPAVATAADRELHSLRLEMFAQLGSVGEEAFAAAAAATSPAEPAAPAWQLVVSALALRCSTIMPPVLREVVAAGAIMTSSAWGNATGARAGRALVMRSRWHVPLTSFKVVGGLWRLSGTSVSLMSLQEPQAQLQSSSTHLIPTRSGG